MDRYEISGGRRLTGEIHVQGAKNSVLPILAATVLTADRCVIHNCPALSDTALTIRILRTLGCRDDWRQGKQAQLALPRFGTLEEVLPSAIFLASDPDGNLYTGQTLGPNLGDVML